MIYGIQVLWTHLLEKVQKICKEHGGPKGS